MNIFISGINYKTTSLEIREKLSFTTLEQKAVLKEIHRLSCVSECVFLSTCNRTEMYIYTESGDFSNEIIEKFLCEIKGLNIYDFKKYFYFYEGVKAAKHLFKVACGLDSQVLGEDQILRQVRDANELSINLGTSSGVLNTLFREAVTASKRVKTDTCLSRNSVSVGSLAVKLVSEVFPGRLNDKCVLVIGVGQTGLIALKNLVSKEIAKIYVTNRTHGKAVDLSKSCSSVQVVEYNDRYSVIDECDIVISSTTSPHYTITRDMMEKHILDFKDRVVIDLAVPRDIDVDVKEIEGVRYFNIDNLRMTLDENINKRLLEVSRAEGIIDEFILEYEKWYQFRGVLPVVRDIQKHMADVINEKMNRAITKLKGLNEKDKEMVRASIISAVNGIVNKFIYGIREYGGKDDIQTYVKCLNEAIKD